MTQSEQAKNGRWLRHCAWCGVPCYGYACREHRVIEERYRELYRGLDKAKEAGK